MIADFYVKDQSLKVKTAFSTRKGKGEYCCGATPYGYQKNPEDKNELLIVEEEAEIIRRIFDLTIQRYRKMEICQILNNEGVPTPLQSMRNRQKSHKNENPSRGMQWNRDMIRKILEDKNYIGCMVYGKTWIPDPGTGKEEHVPRDCWKVIENHHEPIVSKETFEKAQAVQIRHIHKSRYDKTQTVLSGYLKCGNCKRRLTGSSNERGHIYYSCPNSRGKEDTGCFCGKADNRIIEQLVLEKIRAYLQKNINLGQLQQSVKKQHQDSLKEYQEERRNCEKRQEQMKQQNLKNYESYRNGDLTREQFTRKKKKLDKEKGALQKQIQELEEQIRKEGEILQKSIPVEKMTEFIGCEELTADMLEEYVEEVFVYDNGRVEVKWKEMKEN